MTMHAKARKALSVAFVGVAVAGFSMSAYGDNHTKRYAESQYRHDNMEHAKYSLSNILQILKGEATHDGHLAQLTKIMASSASMAKSTFEKDTRDMEGHTEAKDEIWENWSDYAARMDQYAADTAALAAVAETGDMSAFRPAFQKAVSHCKGCHDKYRD